MPRTLRTRGLTQVPSARNLCLEITDHSVTRKSAVEFFELGKVDQRTVAAQAARLADQFVLANRRMAALLEVTFERDYDGKQVYLLIRSGSAVGAIPLVSPANAKTDLGIVVQPRFPWAGIGPMLAEMGWRIVPSLLRAPLLRRSERRVPLWLLSSMILTRLTGLLNSLSRKFEMVDETRRSPRGRVHWDQYIRRSMAVGNLLAIPCSFPDLEDDRLLKGAIRYTLQKQIQSLQSQKEHGAFVLIEFAQELFVRVADVPNNCPSRPLLQVWMQRPLRDDRFLDGLQAIEWTVEERGLAGVSDLQGLPWRMSMDQFFEAWIETVFRAAARKTGAQVKTGRQHQTNHAIDWQPPYIGSQKSLLPDILLEWTNTTLIVDAKYKRHWEELNRHNWSQVEDEIQEHHRADLFQILAYANLSKTNTVIACLVYPCTFKTWNQLENSGRLIHKAIISGGTRMVHLWLTAVPMIAECQSISDRLAESIRSALVA